ncbi:MAG: hypothetical protein R2822_07305 [Spirosomataceae bacterium]
MKLLSIVLIFLLSSFGILAQVPIGIFENHADIGQVLHTGTAAYDKTTQSYQLSGSGENIWFKKDELHLAWRKLKGDFLLQTHVKFIGAGTDAHRKIGWMARTSLDTSAAMVCLTVHGDGLTAFQYRKKNNTNIEEVKSPVVNPDILQLERRGRSYIVSVAKAGSPFWSVEIPDIDFPEELYVGIFVCAHNKNVVEQAVFSNLRVFTAVK